MKIKYITESYFKNPEQAKAAREKERELSNAEKIAGVSSKIMKEPLIKFINDGFDNYYNPRGRSNAYCIKYFYICTHIFYGITAFSVIFSCLRRL